MAPTRGNNLPQHSCESGAIRPYSCAVTRPSSPRHMITRLLYVDMPFSASQDQTMLPYHVVCNAAPFWARSTPVPAKHREAPASPAQTPPAALAHLLAVSYGVEVQYDKVAVGHVEARQVVACVFCVIDVLVHNVRSAAGLLRVATAEHASNSDIAVTGRGGDKVKVCWGSCASHVCVGNNAHCASLGHCGLKVDAHRPSPIQGTWSTFKVSRPTCTAAVECCQLWIEREADSHGHGCADAPLSPAQPHDTPR